MNIGKFIIEKKRQMKPEYFSDRALILLYLPIKWS